jgi:TonB family protein
MKIAAITMLLMWLPAPPQVGTLEKQALDTVKRMMVSRLDVGLPGYSFATWFNNVIGPEAGVVWQLTECGESIVHQNGAERDLIACTEADAILPDGRKVVVAISVGTFKKGIYGEPAFYSAVIEDNNRLYEVRRLRDLPVILHSARTIPIRLPDVTSDFRVVRATARPGYISSPNVAYPYPHPYPASPIKPETLPIEADPPEKPPAEKPLAEKPPAEKPPAEKLLAGKPPEPKKPPKAGGGLQRGRAIVQVNPIYPSNTRSLDPFFRSAMVMVEVSEQGRVIDARVTRGHPLLHGAVLEAARKWVFEPTTLNGIPIKVKNILNFVFSPGSR